MTQIWKDDKVVPVTVIKLDEKSDPAMVRQLADEAGKLVKISGTSKGKGFQGVVKRWSFAGGPKTHGQKNRLRAPGSIGSTAPQRVVPGRKMPGRMGGERVTVRNLKIMEVRPESREILLKGAIPGNRGNKVEIRL